MGREGRGGIEKSFNSFEPTGGEIPLLFQAQPASARSGREGVYASLRAARTARLGIRNRAALHQLMLPGGTLPLALPQLCSCRRFSSSLDGQGRISGSVVIEKSP